VLIYKLNLRTTGIVEVSCGIDFTQREKSSAKHRCVQLGLLIKQERTRWSLLVPINFRSAFG
jgi:hypothetical protein